MGQAALESGDSVPLVLTVPSVLKTPEASSVKEQMSDGRCGGINWQVTDPKQTRPHQGPLKGGEQDGFSPRASGDITTSPEQSRNRPF